MATNNNTNFPHLTSKATPTTSDILFLSDQADSGKFKQSTVGSFPALNAQQVTQYNPSGFGLFSCQMPGMLNDVQSDSITQSMGTILNGSVFLVPFYLSTAWTVTALYLIVKTGLAASTATMGIYASTPASGGTHANKPVGSALVAGSVATTASNSIVNISFSQALSANTLYFAALQLSSSTTLAIAVGGINFGSAVVTGVNGGITAHLGSILTYSSAYSAGTLPTLTQTSIANTALNYCPIMAGI